MKLADSTVLWIFILWLALVAARIAFNLWRSYRYEARNRAEMFTDRPVATPSRGPARESKARVETVGDCSSPDQRARAAGL